MAEGMPGGYAHDAQKQEASNPGKMTPPPDYSEQPIYPISPLANPGDWQQPYLAAMAPYGYTSLPVASGVTADDAMLIPGVSEQRVVVRERESFVKQIILSCLVFWLCCWPLGLIAFILAVLAFYQARAPDDQSAAQAHMLGVYSTWTSIAAAIIGTAIIIAFIIYLAVVQQNQPHY